MHKLVNYISSLWNLLDLFCILFYILGTIFLECFATTENHPLEEWGRICVMLSLVFFYVRLLNMFAVSRALGPKIKMIWEMWRDLRYPHSSDGRVCGLVPRIGRIPQRARIFLLRIGRHCSQKLVATIWRVFHRVHRDHEA